MARTVVTHITDDLDGTSGAEEVAFSFDGTDYTIDLAKKNRAAFEKALKPFLDGATRQTRRTSTKRTTKTGKRDLAAIREWANQQGVEVSGRGRIRASVLEQYDAAH
jgi:nucleoid-associated protein Lsr2